MVTTKGFIFKDGKYYDLGDNTELTINTLEHSTYGTIKYVTHNGTNYPVSYVPGEDWNMLPDDWVEEIE